MSIEIRSGVVVARPRSEVFDYVINLDRNGPEWASDLESVTKKSEGPVGPGSEFAQVQRVAGRRRETSVRFVAVERDERIDAEADIGVATIEASLIFGIVNDEATVVAFVGRPRPHGAYRFLSPMIRSQGQRLWDNRLAGLRDAMKHRSA